MASEAQRAARALMDRRAERFESRHPLAESRSRLEGTLSRARLEGTVAFTCAWSEVGGKAVLDARFAPPRRTSIILQGLSVTLVALLAGAGWAHYSGEMKPGITWTLTFLVTLAIFAMPWVSIAMGSSRLAEEARITRAIKAALLDEDEKLPPAKKWDD